MKLISNSMHWAWKLSFAPCAFWMAISWLTALGNWGAVGTEDSLAVGIIPIGIWLTIRWLTVTE